MGASLVVKCLLWQAPALRNRLFSIECSAPCVKRKSSSCRKTMPYVNHRSWALAREAVPGNGLNQKAPLANLWLRRARSRWKFNVALFFRGSESESQSSSEDYVVLAVP